MVVRDGAVPSVVPTVIGSCRSLEGCTSLCTRRAVSTVFHPPQPAGALSPSPQPSGIPLSWA